ncbi:sulfurtransferase [Roseivirga seohaensis]|uniref:Sulfurtransferase n=1 Tax=Roseivirga seohaensis TaxID=1914963 RepID=A0A150XNP6_9BACT|nr:rhodanese-like domain-containing protein [Roseivirga seohaensis]KYG80369.1 sulfurtransferase [Roseivirga seohaensis]
MNIEEQINQGKASIVDVRSPEEFRGGHVANSVNIPLPEVPQRIEELKAMKAPLVLCCASGNRSGQAEQFLSSYGIECYNGGSWLDVNYVQSKNV